jgi:glutathione S-transferase
MPTIQHTNPALKELVGIHLWHAPLSSCSQRVRLALAEKERDYGSHPIRLELAENANAEYQKIHPAGLVPAMVIDGELVIESIDIIAEIDRQFSPGSLRPADKRIEAEISGLLERADRAQPDLKLLTFEFLFSAAPPPEETIRRIAERHSNAALRHFYRDFVDGFSRDRITAAAQACHADLMVLERRLADGRDYVAGANFSLADIAWIPNVHRYDLIGWPLAKYPALKRWYDRMKQRQSYQTAIADCEPKELIDVALPRIQKRIEAGDGVASYYEFEE